MMNATQSNTQEVQYTITGKISVGHVLNIHPSEAYQGIEAGIIRITAVGKFGSLGEHNEEAANHYAMLQELLVDIAPLEDFTFVAYKYDGIDEVGVLELEEFLDHTTTY